MDAKNLLIPEMGFAASTGAIAGFLTVISTVPIEVFFIDGSFNSKGLSIAFFTVVSTGVLTSILGIGVVGLAVVAGTIDSTIGRGVADSAVILLFHLALQDAHSKSAIVVCLIFQVFTGCSEILPHLGHLDILFTGLLLDR